MIIIILSILRKYPLIINQLQLTIAHSVMIDLGINMNMKEAWAQKYNVTKSAIAIAWLLRHPAHMQPIVGTTSLVHLEEMAKAVEVKLTRQEWYNLYLASEKPLP